MQVRPWYPGFQDAYHFPYQSIVGGILGRAERAGPSFPPSLPQMLNCLQRWMVASDCESHAVYPS